MFSFFLDALLVTTVQALPRLFLLGAPLLFFAIVITAFADARLPGSANRHLVD